MLFQVSPSPIPSPSPAPGEAASNALSQMFQRLFDAIFGVIDRLFGWVPEGMLALVLIITACSCVFFLGRRFFGYWGETSLWLLIPGTVIAIGGAIWTTMDATSRMPEAWRGPTAPGLVVIGIIVFSIWAYFKVIR